MSGYAQNSLLIGIVVATYPAGQSIDVVLGEDGSRLSNVQVMVPTGSSDTGIVDLPDIGLPDDDSRWDLTQTPERYVRAVLAFYRGTPVCIGFLLPQENQISFDEKNRHVMRHASGVYTTIDKDGNTEMYHPSGTYLRIGTDPAHEDLTGQDFDKLWKDDKNTDKAVHVHLRVSNAGTSVASLDIDQNGKLTLHLNSDLSLDIDGKTEIDVAGTTTITAHGNTQVDVTGTAKVTSSGAMELKGSSIKLDGPTTVTGALTAQSTVAITGAVTASSTVTATGDVVGAGKSLSTHTHGGVQSGGSLTSPPT